MSALALGPAKGLLGRLLPGGWKVIEAVPRNPYSSGGRFSDGYIAEAETGQRAYVKAVDLAASLHAEDPASMIKTLMESFVFERDLLQACRMKKLNRIVTAIASGQLGETANDLVFYLIFELADGDVRGRLSDLRKIDAAWNLRLLHQVAGALRQLHSQDIAHQDLKPSNVLLFPNEDSKVGDLGRASHKGSLPPHDNYRVAGDQTYAPPELLYGHLAADWNCRRLGCDLYLMGSLVLSLFTGVGMTHFIMSRLKPELKPGRWMGTYEEVLPFIADAIATILRDFVASVESPWGEPLSRIIFELCNPKPLERGHPKNKGRASNSFSLERYVTEFDLLAKRAEVGIFR